MTELKVVTTLDVNGKPCVKHSLVKIHNGVLYIQKGIGEKNSKYEFATYYQNEAEAEVVMRNVVEFIESSK